MKLIQLNIWGGNLIYQANLFLKREKPDILNLQEVNRGAGSDSFYFNVSEKIMDVMKFKYEFFDYKTSSTLAGRKIFRGQSIFSNHPFAYTNTVFTEGKRHENVIFGPPDRQSWFFQHAKIKIGNHILNDLNYHGYWIPEHKKGNALTEKHCRIIADYIDGLNPREKIILTGDFNLSPRSRSMQILNRKLDNLVLRYGVKTTRNKIPITKTPVDFIFVNDRVNVQSFRVPETYISDHLPLILNFT